MADIEKDNVNKGERNTESRSLKLLIQKLNFFIFDLSWMKLSPLCLLRVSHLNDTEHDRLART